MIPQTHSKFPELRFVGVDGVLVRFGPEMSDQANIAALAFHSHIQSRPIEGVLETAPSLIAVFLRLDLACDSEATLTRIKQELDVKDWLAQPFSPKRKWTIPCSFDGPQLNEAAALAGLSDVAAVKQVLASEVRVLTIGFAPGQPYLGTLEPHWNIPRLEGVAPQVPAGALVVAVRQLIIFSTDAPTGWRHIGQTAFRCFDQNRAMPFAFQPGDLVQFSQAASDEIERLQSDPFGGARVEDFV